MRKWIILFLAAAAVFAYFYSCKAYWLLKPRFSTVKMDNVDFREAPSGALAEGLAQLKKREDAQAYLNFEKATQDNEYRVDALWGKAEVLRRRRKYEESAEMLKQIISVNPTHVRSLVSLSYIECDAGRFREAEALLSRALDLSNSKEDASSAYVMLAAVNAARAKKGNILAKIKYGPQIKSYLDKAVELGPGLPETHLALGTFYLTAPRIIGGADLDKAEAELNLALKIAPDFATANARLAQYSRKKYDYIKYNFYIEAAERLDPDNEVLQELKQKR